MHFLQVLSLAGVASAAALIAPQYAPSDIHRFNLMVKDPASAYPEDLRPLRLKENLTSGEYFLMVDETGLPLSDFWLRKRKHHEEEKDLKTVLPNSKKGWLFIDGEQKNMTDRQLINSRETVKVLVGGEPEPYDPKPYEWRSEDGEERITHAHNEETFGGRDYHLLLCHREIDFDGTEADVLSFGPFRGSNVDDDCDPIELIRVCKAEGSRECLKAMDKDGEHEVSLVKMLLGLF